MNRLKNSFMTNGITFGGWIQIPNAGVAEVMSTAGFDWICIDAEHGIFDLDSIANVMRGINGPVPVVRVPKLDEIWIHRVLDLGARGLIVPMIKSKEDVDRLISYAKYPPIGDRGYGFSRQNCYGTIPQSSSKILDDELSIIVQIEHIDAIINLREILDNEYIDGSFIGPLDLKWSMSNDNSYDYDNALGVYKKISKEMNKPTGMHIIHPNAKNVSKAIDDGYKTIALGLDVTYLSDVCEETVCLAVDIREEKKNI